MSGDLPEVLLATRRGINTGAGEACIVGVSVAVTVTAGVFVIEGKLVRYGVPVNRGVAVSSKKGVWDDIGVKAGVGLGGFRGEVIKATAIVVMDPMTATQIATGTFHLKLLLLLTLRLEDFSFGFPPVSLLPSLLEGFSLLSTVFPPYLV
jgi:hypothetical protein